MSQTSKKVNTPDTKTPAKIHAASETTKHHVDNAVEVATETAHKNVDSAKHAAHAVVEKGADNLKELFASTAHEARKSHEKLIDVTEKSTGHVLKTVDALERTTNDIHALLRRQADVATEVSNIISDISKNAGEAILENANHAFSSHLEICNEIFGCKNIKDAFEIHGKITRNRLNYALDQSSVVVETVFDLINEASQPVNEMVSETTERFYRNLSR